VGDLTETAARWSAKRSMRHIKHLLPSSAAMGVATNS
jgi:hypothetical protein